MSVRDYPGDGIVVHWTSELCIHSGNCYGGLPEVFRPQERPWVRTDAADAARIEAQVARCPSGALTSTRPAAAPDAVARAAVPTITVLPDGPYVVSGEVEIRTKDGDLVRATRKVSLCRCGRSADKPYCDGTHARVGFRDPGPAVPGGAGA
jgi:uncharacterized Fe-S cluster protein YjdI/CDGSH-type Zn-finger protein